MKNPPKILLRFFRWFCDPQLFTYIEGDLYELYDDNVQSQGRISANWFFFLEIIKLMRPSLMRKLSGTNQLNQYGMFKSHLKVAFRVLKREKFFTLINIIGLACGIWCTLLTYYWIQDEYSHDRFHEKGDQLFRVMMNLDINGVQYTEESTAFPLGDVLVDEFPEVTNRVRYSYEEPIAVTINGQLSEQLFASSDPNIFEVFSFPMLQGSPKECLSDQKSIVISEKLAEAYFKDQSAIGEIITIHEGPNKLEFIVTGVFADIPDNSSIQFDLLIPIDNLLAFYENMNGWGNPWFATYILSDSEPNILAERIRELPLEKAGVDWYSLTVQKYQDQYLYDRFENFQQAGGRIDTIFLFGMVAVFTLIIACFNYINITTARSLRRDRELGVRKIIGASKSTLIFQFLMESSLIILFAIFLAFGLTYFSLPIFNAITGKSIEIDLFDLQLLQLIIGIFIITLLISGLYPAISTTRFGKNLLNPLSNKTGRSSLVRRGLVTLQFCLSIILVSGAITVYQQLSFISDKDLGLDKENIIYLELDQHSNEKYREIKSALADHSSIAEVSGSNHDFIGPLGYTGDVKWRLKPENAEQFFFGVQNVDSEMLELLDIVIKSGSYFAQELHPDSTQFIINEAAANVLGFDDPLGERLSFWGKNGTIVGVTEDFHFSTLHEEIQPLVMRNVIDPNYVFIKTNEGYTQEALAYLERVHNEFSDFPVNYHFLDREIDSKYQEEASMQKLAYGFSVLALLICSLGLIGLVSYSIESRTKEIAIRKVLGASLYSLGRLLFKEYIWLLVISMLIGVPVIVYWSTKWLENYPYHIDFSPTILVLGFGALVLISTSIIFSYIGKVQASNPADSLRDE